MRKFVDLSIKPKDEKTLMEMLSFLKDKLDVSVVGIEYGNLCEKSKELEDKIGIRVVCVIELKGNTRRDIAKELLKARKVKGLKVGVASTLDTARYTAIKSEIDIVKLEPKAYKFIDKSQSLLLKRKERKPIELSLKEVLKDPRKLPDLLNAIRRAFSYDIDLILVSDASRVQELIHPLSMASIAGLAGVPEPLMFSYISTIPLSIIKRKGL